MPRDEIEQVQEDQAAVESADPPTPKASWMWLKDDKGNASVSVTFLTISFWVVIGSYILSMISKIGPIELRPFDPMAATAVLTPAMALYGVRKHTDAKFSAGK